MRLELAADYLVMAAWLAYLKSRLLLPEPPKGEEPSAADLATALALRLHRLEAIREAAKRLADRDRLGRDVFPRGAPEPVADRSRRAGTRRSTTSCRPMPGSARSSSTPASSCPSGKVWSLAEARDVLDRLIGAGDWIAARRVSCRATWRSPRCAPRCALPRSRRRWKWCAKGGLNFGKTEPFAPL